MNDFVAYVEKTVVNRIFTNFFRYTGMLHPSMYLDVKEVRETENGEHLRIEGAILDDREAEDDTQ